MHSRLLECRRGWSALNPNLGDSQDSCPVYPALLEQQQSIIRPLQREFLHLRLDPDLSR